MTTTDPCTLPLNGKPFDFFETVNIMANWQRVLHGDSPAVELRVPKCSHAKFRKPHTRRGYFEPAQFEAMCKQGLVLNREMTVNVYATLNPVNPDLLSRCCNREDVGDDTASDANIDRRRWILIDLDPKRIAGVSSTDDEKAAAFTLAILVLRFLDAAGWPTPIVADSGNGWHLLTRGNQAPAGDGYEAGGKAFAEATRSVEGAQVSDRRADDEDQAGYSQPTRSRSASRSRPVRSAQ